MIFIFLSLSLDVKQGECHFLQWPFMFNFTEKLHHLRYNKKKLGLYINFHFDHYPLTKKIITGYIFDPYPPK